MQISGKTVFEKIQDGDWNKKNRLKPPSWIFEESFFPQNLRLTNTK
jgi:hypothetical protein